MVLTISPVVVLLFAVVFLLFTVVVLLCTVVVMMIGFLLLFLVTIRVLGCRCHSLLRRSLLLLSPIHLQARLPVVGL